MPFNNLTPLSRKRKLQWLLVIVLAAFVLRSPAFVNPIIDEDEAWYAVAANMMNHGGLLYQDTVDLKPPLIFYLYSWCFSIFGYDLRTLHVLTVFWVLATAWMIARILRYLDTDANAAWLTAYLYVLFTPTFVPQALATNCEIVMNLPLAASMLFFLKAERAKPHLGARLKISPLRGVCSWAKTSLKFNLFLSGALCSLAFLVKYQSGILLGVFLFYIFYILIAKPILTKKWSMPTALVQSVMAIAGFAAVLAALYGIFQHLGNWEDFYFWGWQYNFTFMSGMTWEFFFKRFFAMTPRFILVWIILWVFAFAAIKKTLRHPREISTARHLMILWLTGSAVAVCAGGKFFGHYYIQLLPPLVILAAQALSEWRQKSAALKFANWKRGFVLAAIVLPPTIYLIVNWQVELKRMTHEHQLFRMLAEDVRQQTSEADKIFVWGRMPELYYFSQRLPASRFITCNFVVGMTTYNYDDREARMVDAGFSRAGELLLKDLQHNRPKLIIDTSPLDFRQYGKYPVSAFPRLQDFLRENYRALKNSSGLEIYEARF